MAAFFSACFLVFAGSPAKLIPASSTVDENTGECPGPDLTVVYTGSFSPALCAVSCSKFLYTPVSSYTTKSHTTSQIIFINHDDDDERTEQSYEHAGSEGGGGAAEGEAGEGDLGGGVLGLPERGAVGWPVEGLAIEGDGGLEPRRVVGPFPRAHVRRQAEAAPLRQLLQLVLVHRSSSFVSLSSPPPPSLLLFFSHHLIMASSSPLMDNRERGGREIRLGVLGEIGRWRKEKKRKVRVCLLVVVVLLLL